MGSRGSDFNKGNQSANEFGVKAETISQIRKMEPDNKAVTLFRDKNEYTFDDDGNMNKDAYFTVPYEHYVIDGDDYYRMEYNGKEYIFDYDGWDSIAEKLSKDNDWGDDIEMSDEYFETDKDAYNYAQEQADKGWEEYSSDPWNFIDDNEDNHKKVKW